MLEPGGEWTVEANPGTLDAAKADVLAAGGVNRVSLGAQSFQPELLKALERNHAPDEIARALELVRPRFARWSFDLIFGVPGSTPAMWAADLEAALALGPDHLSCYGLVFEKGTALWKQERAGLVRPVDEEAERAMYEHTIDRLGAAGLAMYEISNFARPGHESRHNLIYWANWAYFGVGLGAARYADGVRSSNTRDLPAYLKRIEAGLDATGPTETLTPEERARETAVLMLRRTDRGLDRAEFSRQTGFDFDALAGGRPDQASHRRAARRRRVAGPVQPVGTLPGRHGPLRPTLTARTSPRAGRPWCRGAGRRCRTGFAPSSRPPRTSRRTRDPRSS